MLSNTPSCVIRISHSSQITLPQLGQTPDEYLFVPHMSHSTLVSEMTFRLLSTLFIMSLPSYNVYDPILTYAPPFKFGNSFSSVSKNQYSTNRLFLLNGDTCT